MRFSILIPLAVLGVAMAQGPGQPPSGTEGPGGPGMPMRPSHLGALKAYLNLSDAQIEQMQKAREEARKQAFEKAKAIFPQIRAKHAALRDLLAKDTADALTVGNAMLEIRALKKQIRQAHEAVRESQIKVLTVEQQDKLKALQTSVQQSAAAAEAARSGLVPGGPGAGFGGHRRGMMGRGPGGMGQGQGFMGPGGPSGMPQGQGFGPGRGMMGRGRGMGQGRGAGTCPCMQHQAGPEKPGNVPPPPPAQD
jgi:Spy/CpxP family protein refolding chaperone